MEVPGGGSDGAGRTSRLRPPGAERTAPLLHTLGTNPEAPLHREGGTRGKEPRGGKRVVSGSRCRSRADPERGHRYPVRETKIPSEGEH